MTGFFDPEKEAPFPSTAQWLAAGGDTRIVCDPERGRNRYGCLPVPEPEVLAYGSSTASPVSLAGLAAAEALRQRLELAGRTEAPSTTYARELDRLRGELAAAWDLEAVSGLRIVFGTSGTDLHLFAAQLAAGAGSRPSLIVRVEAGETGRGVPAALSGCHFSERTALGGGVAAGVPLDLGRPVEVLEIPCRAPHGEEIEEAVARAVAQGRQVLLVLVDVSKTGLLAPSPARILALRRRFPAAVDVLVDACQFRLALPTLRAYLEQGFLVAVTGSKFMTGPAFCGALLASGEMADRLGIRTVSSALKDYSARADWPRDWAARAVLPEAANYGLLLRWEAALAEMRAFHRLPDAAVAAFLEEFASAVGRRLADDPAFEPLPLPPLDRRPLGRNENWDRVPTLFPFLLRRPGPQGAAWLDRAEAARVCELLRDDLSRRPGMPSPEIAGRRCHLGQPTECGTRDGVPVSALRLCASARLVVAALSGEAERRVVIADALAVLDKAALLASLPAI